MNKVLWLAAVPVALLGLNGLLTGSSNADATVTIAAERPAELRGAVMARVESFGGRRTDEHTDFSGAGASEIRFVIPTARLEEVLVALDQVGGTVISQDVAYANSSTVASNVASGVSDVQSCLGQVSGALSGGGSGAQSALADCQSNLRTVSNQLSSVEANVAETELAVEVVRPSTFKWATVIAIAAILMVLVAAGILIYRFVEADPEDDPGFPVEAGPTLTLSEHQRN